MRRTISFLFTIFSIGLLFYVLLPNPAYPAPLPGSLQSDEPADTETPLRRGYYTDLSREEVLNHYQAELEKSFFLNLPLPVYRLNYPPEEAQVLIRDQTKSTFLEEIVRPFRESFYVNGFEPKDPKYAIEIDGKSWRQKITTRMMPSNTVARLVVTGLALMLLWVAGREWILASGAFFKKKTN